MNRVVIYGYAIPQGDPRGQGSGSLQDMTYYVTDDVTVEEILTTIERAGCKFIVQRNPYTRAPVQDRVEITPITVGIQRI